MAPSTRVPLEYRVRVWHWHWRWIVNRQGDTLLYEYTSIVLVKLERVQNGGPWPDVGQVSCWWRSHTAKGPNLQTCLEFKCVAIVVFLRIWVSCNTCNEAQGSTPVCVCRSTHHQFSNFQFSLSLYVFLLDVFVAAHLKPFRRSHFLLS